MKLSILTWNYHSQDTPVLKYKGLISINILNPPTQLKLSITTKAKLWNISPKPHPFLGPSQESTLDLIPFYPSPFGNKESIQAISEQGKGIHFREASASSCIRLWVSESVSQSPLSESKVKYWVSVEQEQLSSN